MRLNFVSDVKQAATGSRRRPVWLLAAILVVVVFLTVTKRDQIEVEVPAGARVPAPAQA